MKPTEIDKLGLQLRDFQNFEGDVSSISKNPADSYISRVDLILPLAPGVIPDQLYKTEQENEGHEIRITTLSRMEDDPIYQACKSIAFGLPDGNEEMLRFNGFSDNRGKYPAVLAQILFPYRIATWIDSEHPAGIELGVDRERLEITGGQHNEEKIAALIQINRLIRSLDSKATKSISYEDVTCFTETYFRKGNKKPLMRKDNVLASPHAYRNAILDHFVPQYESSGTEKIVAEILERHSDQSINSESELKDAVDSVIDNVLKHQIETRRWVEPFWDEGKEVEVKGVKKQISKSPKSEPKIQPTLYVVFDLVLAPLGVHVAREPNEGVGSIDFRFLFTTARGLRISTCAEFKLAHSKKIRHGINHQLPEYMRATQTKSGSFILMWFKDGKNFREPKGREKLEAEEWIEQEAKKASKDNKIVITAVMVDASIRPSASVA